VAPELLNAAEGVLVKDGLRGLTVRAVAAEAGVAPMSVYNQFGGKAALGERESARARKHAGGCLGLLARNVELAAAAGVIAVRDAREAAQQIWCALHGAVALELGGLAQTLDPAATYRALVETILRGLAGSRMGNTE
jgi:hypothetical protein